LTPPHPPYGLERQNNGAIDEASYGSRAPDGRPSAGIEDKRIHRAVA